MTPATCKGKREPTTSKHPNKQIKPNSRSKGNQAAAPRGKARAGLEPAVPELTAGSAQPRAGDSKLPGCAAAHARSRAARSGRASRRHFGRAAPPDPARRCRPRAVKLKGAGLRLRALLPDPRPPLAAAVSARARLLSGECGVGQRRSECPLWQLSLYLASCI